MHNTVTASNTAASNTENHSGPEQSATQSVTERIGGDLEQVRAARSVKDVANVGAKRGEYLRVVRRFLLLVRTGGLLQALAFLKSKSRGRSNDVHEHLFRHLSIFVLKSLGKAGSGDLLTQLMDGSSVDLLRATREANSYAMWLARSAEIAPVVAPSTVSTTNPVAVAVPEEDKSLGGNSQEGASEVVAVTETATIAVTEAETSEEAVSEDGAGQ